MTPEPAAAACKDAVSVLPSHFMLDMATYKAGADLGFSGLDFYVAGRGGALGDVDADVVSAAFVLWEPGNIRKNWEQGVAVMPARDAAAAFIAVGHRWATEHLDEGACDWARLAELVGRLNVAAPLGCAPLFAGWRAMPEPADGDARALALHRLNLQRELRFAIHAAALVAHGIGILDAMAVASPGMVGLFGWTAEPPEVTDELRARWTTVEDATNRGLASTYGALDESERAELVELCSAAAAAVR